MDFWKIAALVTWAALFLALLVFLYLNNHGRVIRSGLWFGKEVMLGSRLHGSINQMFDELAEGKVKRDTSANVLKHVLWRLTRIGAFAITATLVPILFLLFQLFLLINQNNLIDQQTHLLEAERRSSLVFLMSNILDKVDEEIKLQQKELDSTASDSVRYKLSDQLVSRIIALSRSLQPYRLKDGNLLSRPISPERGQLFIALMVSRINKSDLATIGFAGDFSYAIIGDIPLSNASLFSARLEYADFQGVALNGADLTSADLSKANLSNAYLVSSNLSGANLSGANLRDADIANSDLRNADLTGVEHVSISMLRSARSLYNTKGIEQWKNELMTISPCLFTENGCPVED